MSDRKEIINELLELQRKFIAYEKAQEAGFSMSDYYIDDEDHPLYHYREKYNDLAMKLVDQAHIDRGSKR